MYQLIGYAPEVRKIDGEECMTLQPAVLAESNSSEDIVKIMAQPTTQQLFTELDYIRWELAFRQGLAHGQVQ